MGELLVVIGALGAVLVGMLQYAKKLIQNNDKDRRSCLKEIEALKQDKLKLIQQRNSAYYSAKHWKEKALKEYDFNQRLLTSLSKTANIRSNKVNTKVETDVNKPISKPD